jgi:putative salt-induced outer membrane protein
MKKAVFLVVAGAAVAGAVARGDGSAWDMSASLGLNATRGNSETLTVTPEFRAAGKLGANELKFSAAYSYGETEGEITERKAKGVAQYNRLFTERWYAYANGEIGNDDLAGVNYRAVVGPGAGCYIIKSDGMNLSAEAGASWVADEIEVETSPGVTDTETSSEIACRLVQKFDVKLGKSARAWESVEFLPQIDDFDVYLLTAEIGLEAAVNGSLSLRTTVGNVHDSEPAPGKEKDDTTVKAALVYKFVGKP